MSYQNLITYQQSEIIHDYTVEFCQLYIPKYSRTTDQMEQAARSGKQNIVEGSQFSRVSSKMEIKLVGVARASLAELLKDYEDYLRQHNLKIWAKDSAAAREIRALSHRTDRSYRIYRTYLADAETAANVAICLIHQTNYLLDRQINALEKKFLEQGGYTENLFKRRVEYRNRTDRSDRTDRNDRTDRTTTPRLGSGPSATDGWSEIGSPPAAEIRSPNDRTDRTDRT